MESIPMPLDVSVCHLTLSECSYYAAQPSCGIIAPPYVVSTSYGQDEATATTFYAKRQCWEYAKVGLLTVFISRYPA